MKMLLNNSIFPEGAKNYIIFFQCFFIGLNNHKFIAKIIACKKNHRRSQTTSNQIILNQLDFQAVPVLVGQDHGGLEDHVVGHGDLGESEVGHGRVGHGSP